VRGLLSSGDLPPEGGWRQERERWINGWAWVLFEAAESRSCSCLEGSSSFDRWEWALIVIEGIESGVVRAAMERAEFNELPMLPTALLPLDSVPGLRLEMEMEMLLPLLLKVPTSLPSPSDRPGKLKSSSTTSKAAPGFITRVISSKRSSHYSVFSIVGWRKRRRTLSSGTPRAIRLMCTKSNDSFGNGRPSRLWESMMRIRDGWANIQIASDPAYSSHKVLVSGETRKVGVERYDIEACKWSGLVASSKGRTDRRLRSLSSAWQHRLPIRRSRSLYPIFS
jgi:hypothetical protein